MDQVPENTLADAPATAANEDSQSQIHTAPEHVHGPNCSHGHHHASHDPMVRAEAKVGRNDPCPCGSQQKFKKCHGK